MKASEDAMTITVYPWQDAPQPLQNLSQHGGDEDWVVVCSQPPTEEHWRGVLGALLFSPGRDADMGRDYVPGWGFVERYEDSGRVVFITAHA